MILTVDNLIEFVNKTELGCWEWTGKLTACGYASITSKLGHRVVWELYNGKIPKLPGYHGGVIRHSCHNRKCINPEHLILGTTRDNVNDMLIAGRSNTIKGSSALSNAQAEEVKRLRAEENWTYQALADHFGMAVGSIHEIVNGRNKGPKGKNGKRSYRSLLPKEGQVDYPLPKFSTDLIPDEEVTLRKKALKFREKAQMLKSQVVEISKTISELLAQAKELEHKACQLSEEMTN
jgi:transcriptional regulator with XRE-family HTH domain